MSTQEVIEVIITCAASVKKKKKIERKKVRESGQGSHPVHLTLMRQGMNTYNDFSKCLKICSFREKNYTRKGVG